MARRPDLRSRNRFRISLRDLERSTGHAPGEELVEIEPEVEHHYEPPIRVTPMSPGTEVQAFGQINPPPGRVRGARLAAWTLLVLFGVSVGFSLGQQLDWW